MKKTLLTLALVFAATPVWAGMQVSLRPYVEINREAIRLADVFDGIPQDLDREIATAPQPGKTVTYDQRVLTKLADDYRLDWQAQGPSDKTIISRGATRITLDMIQKAVEAKLDENKSMKDKTLELSFDNRNLVVNLPADRSPDFTLANFTYDEQNHRFRTDLVAQTSGQPVNQLVTGRVVVKKTVPVLIRRLASGTTIGPSDLDWITVNEDQIGLDVIAQAQQLVGQELRHDQVEGEMLRNRDVMPPRLVTRGSLVTLKIETPLMLITAQGRALQDGGKGDVVRITNTQSNRVIEGTVEGTGLVRVGSLQKMAAAQ